MRDSVQDDRQGLRFLALASAMLAFAVTPGCAQRVPPQGPDAGQVGSASPAAPVIQEAEAAPPEEAEPAMGDRAPVRRGRQIGARISTYYLSAGDEIRISVFGYNDLTRPVRIPPDGHLFFPMAGDIDVDGMSIPELREVIAEKLRSADEQRIGTGDQIVVRVFRQEDLTIQTVVPSSGRVNMPLAGEITLSGLTVEEANQAIAAKLSPYVVKPSVSTTIERSASGLSGPIAHPQVSVEVTAFGGHKILVLGEVERPGVYVNEGGSRLLEVVARAGGPTDDAKMKNVALIRPATETSPPRSAVLDLERAMKTGGLDQNPPVQRGDVIYVPRTTIANVARFFAYVNAIVRPIVTIETGIWLGQNIEAGAEQRLPPGLVIE